MTKKRIIVIHPGVQHAYRLANALQKSGLFKHVTLCTWFILKNRNVLAQFSIFKKRLKHIDKGVRIINYPIFELLYIVHERVFFFLFKRLKNTNYNNIQYLWSTVFSWFMVPYLFINRKSSIVVLYDTCGWPLSYFAKKWGMHVVMDFPSISHEAAIALGVNETKKGIKIKVKERSNIDSAIYCSDFAKKTYTNKTSAFQHFTAHVGAELVEINNAAVDHSSPILNIAFIANMELRKGLDILLDAVKELTIPFKLHLVGKISKSWVFDRAAPQLLKKQCLIFAGPFDQRELVKYLQTNNIQLHILPSRFDSFGMVVPETMMLGIPNIVSPFVGAGEKIEDGKSGYIMQELSASEIKNKICDYYSLPIAEKQELSRNSLAGSREISWSQYDLSINRIFKEILDRIKPNIAFIVTHPTQFEVPFYQYVSNTHKNAALDVIYINPDLERYFDREIGRNVDWGFNLLEGYNYYQLRQGHERNDLKKVLNKNRYDLVITNGYNGPYLKFIDILFRNNGLLALRLDSIMQNQPAGWKLWKAPLLRFFFSRFDRFFAVGTLSKAYLTYLGQPHNKIEYFSYSIDKTKFEAPDLKHLNELKRNLNPQNNKIFICVSKLVKRESPLDVIEAFIAAKRKDWTLLIAGAGDDMDGLTEYCDGYPDVNIKFLGYVPYKNLATYYHLADVFVHSTLEENWGVSVHEAIAANCTVITSDTVGSSFDLIESGKNGYTYPYKDTIALRLVMEKALKLDPVTKQKTNEIKLTEWGYPKMWQHISNSINY